MDYDQGYSVDPGIKLMVLLGYICSKFHHYNVNHKGFHENDIYHLNCEKYIYFLIRSNCKKIISKKIPVGVCSL